MTELARAEARVAALRSEIAALEAKLTPERRAWRRRRFLAAWALTAFVIAFVWQRSNLVRAADGDDAVAALVRKRQVLEAELALERCEASREEEQAKLVACREEP